MIVTTSVHFTTPCSNTYKLCAMQFICPPMTTLQVFYTALKLNVTCKKGQKRPNVAVLVGNSADVAGGVRKGLVRSASYGGGRRIPKHLPKPSPSKRGHYWRKVSGHLLLAFTIFTIALSERVENKSSSLGSSFIRGAITLGVTYGPWPSSRSLILICHTCWAVNTPAWGWGLGGRVGRWEIIFFLLFGHGRHGCKLKYVTDFALNAFCANYKMPI